MSYNQQEMEDSIKRMVANVDNAFRKALDVQKSNEELQESNVHLRNQLSHSTTVIGCTVHDDL